MAELVKEGKVKYIGLSECSAQTIRRAHAEREAGAADRVGTGKAGAAT